jgi:hypothetical protein
MDQRDGSNLFISAALEEISPGEHLLFADGIAVPEGNRESDSGESTALGFGPTEAAQWVAPCLVAVAAWLWSAAEAPLKERLTRYLNGCLSGGEQEPDLRSSLIVVAHEFKEICLRSGFDEAESERLKNAFITSCVENPKILRALSA